MILMIVPETLSNVWSVHFDCFIYFKLSVLVLLHILFLCTVFNNVLIGGEPNPQNRGLVYHLGWQFLIKIFR